MVYCIAPGTAQTYNENWGQTLDLNPGDPHLAVESDDHYPNVKFEDDYEVGDAIGPDDDSRAAALRDFWAERGYEIDAFYRATKTQPAIVLGVVASGSDGQEFLTSEGPTRLDAGCVVLQHPRDENNVWVIRPDKFNKKYQPTQPVS